MLESVYLESPILFPKVEATREQWCVPVSRV